MTTAQEFVVYGNQFREDRQPEQALACYIQAIALEHNNPHPWNNYGNVIREMGYPERAIPFLQQAILLDPNLVTARFNLAVSYLLKGDYQQGWPAYEARWQYEHLAGTFPQWPRLWKGEDIKNKTILIWGEQGLGDNIQFLRFAIQLHNQGAKVRMQVPGQVMSLLGGGAVDQVQVLGESPPEYDYWSPIMSLPRHLGVTLDNLSSPNNYIEADRSRAQQWRERLGLKRRLRVAISWSGRRDSWINQHKSVPFDQIIDFIRSTPEIEWINLQVDASPEQVQALTEAGARIVTDEIHSLADTSALITQMDLVISVDTAVSHLSCALGQATWIMLNHYAQDWRWLLNRADSPWYPSARLFRQPSRDQWQPVLQEIRRNLSLFKI